MSNEELRYHNALVAIKVSVDKLFQAIQEGKYDARSIVGDEVLNMVDILEETLED